MFQLNEGIEIDVALALRDQRILNVWMNLPRKIQKLMRCNLTPRHPAIPLVLSLWEPSIKKKLKSISSEDGLSNVSTPRQSAERSDNSILSVSSAISTDDESPWGRRKKPPGLLQSVCAQLFNKSTGHKQKTASVSNQDDYPYSKNEVVEEDTLSDVSNGLGDSSINELVDAAFADSGNSGLLPANPPELPLLTTLGLDLSIECIPRYQNKPKSMYTFICAQDFRRDEFAWHYRNWVM
jgi:F-box protein 30